MATTYVSPTLIGFRDVADGLEFDYRSEHDPAKTWTTRVQNGQAVCNCIGYANHQKCLHLGDALGRAESHQASSHSTAAPALMAPTALPANRPILERRQRSVMIPTPTELTGMIQLANALAMGSGFAIPQHYDSSPKVFAAVYWGWEKDVPPMTVLSHTFVVNGRLEPDAQLLMGMILRARPNCEWRWIVEPNEATGGEVELYIHGIKRSSGKWTPADAMRAGQLTMPKRKMIDFWEEHGAGKKARPVFKLGTDGKPLFEDAPGNWQLWPTRMYAWACVKIAARLGAADVINGMDALNIGGDLLIETEPAALLSESAGFVSAREEFSRDPWHPPAEPSEAPEPPDATPPPAPYAPVDQYLWLPLLVAARTRDFAAVDDRSIGAIVGAEDEDQMLEAIEKWVFAEGETTSLDARIRELLKLATRWQLDRLEDDAKKQPTPMNRGTGLAGAQQRWRDDDFRN